MRAIETTVPLPLDKAEAAVRSALGEQGFGVLTEIDVAARLKAKLGVERPPLKILGACNPSIAARALDADPAVSLLLPCNVVLEQLDGGTRVAAADPRELMVGASMADIAAEAADRLQAALSAVTLAS
ncbi:MAG: DUF302 domain-containing protein [Actinomycetota bacterium]|nr:DUF302 domain-containing protein [Actinomycetota bacterium]